MKIYSTNGKHEKDSEARRKYIADNNWKRLGEVLNFFKERSKT